jgi:ribonuclease P protein component
MLASQFRITSARDFRTVKEKGHLVQSTNFSLSVYDRKDDSPTRFGFILPVKLFPRAVDRNRIKRALSESTRYQLTYLSPGFDCVFLPRVSMLRAYAQDTIREVEEVFNKAKIV